MRHRFTQQTTLGIQPIEEVNVSLKSRDELPPVIAALKHIYVTPDLNEKIFAVLEKKIIANKKKTGRPGMDLWRILVLAVIRHTLDTNWDRMEHIANHDRMVRQILGVHVTDWDVPEEEFAYQTIVDNVSLIDETMLEEINRIVAEYGHRLLKKKDDEAVRYKTDSYVYETNVHFPTDLNLLWDSLRKCLDVIELSMKRDSAIIGWRKIKSIRRQFKSQFRRTSQQVFKGRNEKSICDAVKAYLQFARSLQKRLAEVMPKLEPTMADSLRYYSHYAELLIDQIDRRLLKGEPIPSEEKVYSIFEPHTEWINKGKSNPSVELGHNLLITTDQHSIIMDYKVMEKEKDAVQVQPLIERLRSRYPHLPVFSHSWDKGFFSKENFDWLIESKWAEHIVLPKRGKLTEEEKTREHSKTFIALRHAHSAIESNIHMLEHHGLNRCPDKGLTGYKRCVGLSVLAYNLHLIGNHLNAKEKESIEKEKRKRAA